MQRDGVAVGCDVLRHAAGGFDAWNGEPLADDDDVGVLQAVGGGELAGADAIFFGDAAELLTFFHCVRGTARGGDGARGAACGAADIAASAARNGEALADEQAVWIGAGIGFSQGVGADAVVAGDLGEGLVRLHDVDAAGAVMCAGDEFAARNEQGLADADIVVSQVIGATQGVDAGAVPAGDGPKGITRAHHIGFSQGRKIGDAAAFGGVGQQADIALQVAEAHVLTVIIGLQARDFGLDGVAIWLCGGRSFRARWPVGRSLLAGGCGCGIWLAAGGGLFCRSCGRTKLALRCVGRWSVGLLRKGGRWIVGGWRRVWSGLLIHRRLHGSWRHGHHSSSSGWDACGLGRKESGPGADERGNETETCQRGCKRRSFHVSSLVDLIICST